MYVEHYAGGEPDGQPEWWMVWQYGVVATLACRHVKRMADWKCEPR